MELSRDDLQETTDEAEYAKCNAYMLTDIPNIEFRLILEDSQLGSRGRKRPASEEEPAPTKGLKRSSSVPPGSSTARARARAAKKRSQEAKVKSSGKGASKASGKKSAGKGKGRLHVARASDYTSMAEKYERVSPGRRVFGADLGNTLKAVLCIFCS